MVNMVERKFSTGTAAASAAGAAGASGPAFHFSGDYGKTRVRVARIFRRCGPVHDFVEFQVECLLQGDFQDAYSEGSNANIVPTDTVKNTIIMLLQEFTAPPSPEEFALEIGTRLLEKHDHLTVCTSLVEEVLWTRLADSTGVSHDHAFQLANTRPIGKAVVRAHGATHTIYGGFEGLRLLKTTQSGFENFIRDDRTTLPATQDRIFATEIKAVWRYKEGCGANFDFRKMRMSVMDAIMAEFAGPVRGGKYSASVQQTMYEMATAVLGLEPLITEVSLELPNLHYLPFRTEDFSVKADGSLCVPTSEPSGIIKLRVERDDPPPAAANGGYVKKASK